MNSLIMVLFVAFLGGALPVFMKITMEVIPPQTFIFLRFIIAAIILVPLFLYKKEKLICQLSITLINNSSLIGAIKVPSPPKKVIVNSPLY